DRSEVIRAPRASATRRSSDLRLVLIRHGQSAWNLENRFTGWWDVDLTPRGEAEAKAAGELLAAHGLDFDRCFTSVQTRAIRTLRSEEHTSELQSRDKLVCRLL